MRTDKPSDTVTNAILSERPAPKVLRAVKTNLAEFGKHKDKLFYHLKGRSPISGDVNDDRLWGSLTSLAQLYFLQRALPPPVERKARASKLALALRRASDLAESVRQDNVGVDLVSVLFDGSLPRDPPVEVVRDEHGSPVCDEHGVPRFVYLPTFEIKKLAPILAAYQAAVLRLANDMSTVPSGKPPFLPPSFIQWLATIYKESTYRKAGAGAGPFTRFVMQFRAALDPSYRIPACVDRTVIDAVQDALRRPRVHG